MAKPIKDTPVLKGAEAKAFRENLINCISKNSSGNKTELRSMKASYKAVKSISNGSF